MSGRSGATPRRLASRAALPSGLVAALLAVLLWGVLAPGGSLATMTLAASAAGTPTTGGTPTSARPSQPAPPEPASTTTTAPTPTPVATPPSGGPATMATPGTPPGAPTAISTPRPTLTPARMPTPLAAGPVSATVVRDLSPLSFTLTGRAQVSEATMALAVRAADADPAGSAGWVLTLDVAQFTVAGDPARTLPPGAVTLVGIAIACVGAGPCTLPENAVARPLPLVAGRPTAIVSARPGSGSGEFVITPTFAIAIPGDAAAGNYVTTISVAAAR